MLAEHEFILAFVDIKMPGLSGLETIQQALTISPMTRYYIMSGFDEFEYAKQAIKLKVEDYLLKPLDKKTIQETISAAKDAVQAVKRRRKSIFRNWLESGLNHRKSSLEQFAGYYCSILLVTMDHPDFPKEAILEKLMPYTDNFVSILSENQLFLLCFLMTLTFYAISASSFPDKPIVRESPFSLPLLHPKPRNLLQCLSKYNGILLFGFFWALRTFTF